MDQQLTAAYSHITCEIDDSIMVITLNRPDKLNAYTGAMGSEIEAAFRAADIDPVRAAPSAPAPTSLAVQPVSIPRASTAPVCSATGRRAVRRDPAAALSMRFFAAENPRLPPSTVPQSASASP